MIVCIAEKPSVAKDIANVLGATQKMDGYMEGNGYQVTWTFGHLCELKEPHEYTHAVDAMRYFIASRPQATYIRPAYDGDYMDITDQLEEMFG